MTYKFKSQATGDVKMLAATGDHMLRLLGREPAAQGIIEVADMLAAMQSLRAAIDAAEADSAVAEAQSPDVAADLDADGQADTLAADAVSLRQRVWPMMEMLKRAHAADVPVVWGV